MDKVELLVIYVSVLMWKELMVRIRQLMQKHENAGSGFPFSVFA